MDNKEQDNCGSSVKSNAPHPKTRAGRGGSGVFRNDENGTWSFRVVRDRNYKRTGFRTRAAATAARVEFIRQYERSHGLAKDLTLDEVFSIYMEEGVLSNAAGTVRKRGSVYRHHIGPVFGMRPVSQLHPGEINLFLESCYIRGDAYNGFSGGYSFGYVESFLKCFYAVLGFAYRKRIILREQYSECLIDEAGRIQMPRMKDEDLLRKRMGVRVFTQDEIALMRERISGSPLRIAFEIGLNCGLRVSEVFALTWSDVDLEAASLRVDKQMLSIGGSWAFCQPKYVSSYRTIFINNYLMGLLSESRKLQEDNKRRLGARYTFANRVRDLRTGGTSDDLMVRDFLLVDEQGRNFTSNAFKHWSRVFRLELGIDDFNFHSLRHTFCSQIAALNCPVSELCRMAGHNSIETTMLYYINSTETGERAARKALEMLNTNK